MSRQRPDGAPLDDAARVSRGSDVGRRLTALLLAVAIACSSALRIGVALRDPELDRASAAGLLKSDPALLYYFTERIVEARGLAPSDFRSDPLVQWPEEIDVPAIFTVGQEFLVAWCQLLTRGVLPLHLTCLVAMAVSASVALLGAYGLARELCRSRRAGLFAAALWCVLPANYRTIGFLLVREDLSFPLFALHLALAARAARRESRALFLAAGALLAAALATWHAMSFFVALEVGAPWIRFLATGRNPFALRGSGWIAAPVAIACALVPVLRASGAIAAPALILGAGLWIAARFERRSVATLVACLAVLLGLGLRAPLSARLGEYSHVYDVLWAKLRHLGELPLDPRALSFDARLLWQGPFETFRPSWAFPYLGLALAALPAAFWLLARSRAGSERPAWSAADSCAAVALLALLSAVATWLVSRVVVLPGLLFPVVIAVALGCLERTRIALTAGAATLALQAILFAARMSQTTIAWYRPPGRNDELAALVHAIPALVPPGEAVAADFMSSTAILAHTRRPILLQPKYETAASRARIEEFLTTFFFATPDELRELLLTKYRCRYLLVDRFTLGYLSRYLAGLAPGEESPVGSAAAIFLSQEQTVLESAPGYELLYRSPPTIRQSDGTPYDLFRLYRLRAD